MSTPRYFNPDFEASFRSAPSTPRQSTKSISKLQRIADSDHPGRNLLAQAVPHAAQIYLLIERYRRCVPSPADASRLRVLSDRLLALTFWLEKRSKIGSDAE